MRCHNCWALHTKSAAVVYATYVCLTNYLGQEAVCCSLLLRALVEAVLDLKAAH